MVSLNTGHVNGHVNCESLIGDLGITDSGRGGGWEGWVSWQADPGQTHPWLSQDLAPWASIHTTGHKRWWIEGFWYRYHIINLYYRSFSIVLFLIDVGNRLVENLFYFGSKITVIRILTFWCGSGNGSEYADLYHWIFFYLRAFFISSVQYAHNIEYNPKFNAS